MRVCVVGAGLAGAVLAWRLADAAPGLHVELVTGRSSADATAASGGAVRAYESHPEQRALAIESTAELLASAVLRDRTGFTRVPTTGVLAGVPATEVASRVAEIDAALPGSASVEDAAALASQGWAGLPADAVGVTERHAGHTSPSRWRDHVVGELARRRGVTVTHADATAIAQRGDVVTCHVGGERREHDLVVVAAGAWTAAVLRASGLPADGYRVKSIQYAVHDVDAWPAGWPRQFVDEVSGVFGRPTASGGLLVGVPSAEWDVDPAAPPVTAAQHDEAARLAVARFPGLRLGPARTRVGSADCYCADGPVLAPRPVPGHDRVVTFTGGAGGSVKTALAASRRAAARLVDTGRPAELLSVGRRKGQ